MQYEETKRTSRGRAALEVRRLDLQVGDPRPGRVRREAAGAADDRARELARGAADALAEAGQRHGVGVEEDDDVAARRVPAAVAGAAGVADAAALHDARAVRAGDLGREVGRAVVDDDHLVGPLRVVRERVEHRAQRALGIERGDHHAHALGPSALIPTHPTHAPATRHPGKPGPPDRVGNDALRPTERGSWQTCRHA